MGAGTPPGYPDSQPDNALLRARTQLPVSYSPRPRCTPGWVRRPVNSWSGIQVVLRQGACIEQYAQMRGQVRPDVSGELFESDRQERLDPIEPATVQQRLVLAECETMVDFFGP